MVSERPKTRGPGFDLPDNPGWIPIFKDVGEEPELSYGASGPAYWALLYDTVLRGGATASLVFSYEPSSGYLVEEILGLERVYAAGFWKVVRYSIFSWFKAVLRGWWAEREALESAFKDWIIAWARVKYRRWF